jgi:hypothetical protein
MGEGVVAYEIRAMSFAEILDLGLRLLRDHFTLLVGPALVVYVPLAWVAARVSGEAAARPADLMSEVLLALAFAGVALLATPLLVAAITHAIGESYLGRPTGVGESVRVGLSLILPLVGTWLLASLAILGGTLLLVIPGLYLMLAFLLVAPVMVLERVFGTRALGRSRDLMRGHNLRGFGILFVGSLLASFLGWGVEAGLGWIPVLGPVSAGVVQAASFAYTSCLSVLLYFDIRCRKEAFELDHLARLVEARASAAVS